MISSLVAAQGKQYAKPNEGPEQVGELYSKLPAAQCIGGHTLGNIKPWGFNIYSLHPSVAFSTFSILINPVCFS